MAYHAALSAVYNHYLTAYAPKKTTTQYDTHKEDELRSVYNSIIKLNKEAPLYLLDSSKESRAFAVGLKENARALRNTIASLGGLDEEEMLGRKAVFSSNENIVSASYIGDSVNDDITPSFNIRVTKLASNQVNLGTFLPSDKKALLDPDVYSFDITVNDLSYEFQYNVHEGETNRDLQERLSHLISSADIGITAKVFEDGQGNSSLRLSSTATGLKDNMGFLFDVSDSKTGKRAGTVDYLGLSFISRESSNAEFLLNGEPRSASSNHFTIDKTFEVTLKGINADENETTEVGLKTDLDSLAENVNNLVEGYNSFIRSASEYLNLQPRSSRLLSEMTNITSHYRPELEELGFSFTDSGLLSLNDSVFKRSILEDESHARFSAIKDFTNTILGKTNQISLNPMEYVNKTIVAYKNPGHNFAAPYITSNYSGMLFNSYC